MYPLVFIVGKTAMRILYLDCFSGISGDMAVGALADLGISPSILEWELSKLDLGDCHLHFERRIRGGISGVKFDVHSGAFHDAAQNPDHQAREMVHSAAGSTEDGNLQGHEDHNHDAIHLEHPTSHPHGPRHPPSPNLSAIRDLIEFSDLSGFVKEHACSIFRRIGRAESKIHGVAIEEVQFHEVGALDSIVDVVLTCVGIEALKVERIYFSNLVDGQGTFRSSHGEYPLPGPATLEILQGIPIRQTNVPFELITPTGAAIVAEFNHAVGVFPEMRPEMIGYGLGTRDLAARPNVLRAVVGTLEEPQSSQLVVELQTNIDDLSPEILAAAQGRLLQEGALDVFFTPIQMKKNRPATMLSVLCLPAAVQKLQEIIFAETSTFGIRFRELHRKTLDRETVEVRTSAGQIRVKIGRHEGTILQVAPEFESCKAAAQRGQQPLKRIYELAIEAFWSSSFASERNTSSHLEKVVDLPP
ncbi:MAG: nickel pincer cofactor biosynthesis protein LarC [Verrucomicrobia bacterium]|nr:nickel pincer cofactor biosynthesis protein LarC [Verrucomicrobiota bacterium]